MTSLVEIGPRFVLTPIRIFEGSFGGPTIFANPGKSSLDTGPLQTIVNLFPCSRLHRIHLPRFRPSLVQAYPRTKVQAEEECAVREGRQADKAEGRVGGGRARRRTGLCLGSSWSGWCSLSAFWSVHVVVVSYYIISFVLHVGAWYAPLDRYSAFISPDMLVLSERYMENARSSSSVASSRFVFIKSSSPPPIA